MVGNLPDDYLLIHSLDYGCLFYIGKRLYPIVNDDLDVMELIENELAALSEMKTKFSLRPIETGLSST